MQPCPAPSSRTPKPLPTPRAPSEPPVFTAVAVWTSVRSTSLNVIVPVSDRVGLVASSVTAPAASVKAVVIVGPSFVPVIVTVTLPFELLEDREPSLTLSWYTSVKVWPARKELKAESGAWNVQLI